MSVEELKEKLLDDGYEDVILFDDFADAFLGITYDNRAVYSFAKMVDCLVKQGDTEEDATEYIEFNCCNCLGEGMPIVIFEI